MTKKKNTQVQVSQEENALAQRVLQRYHELANNLRATTDQPHAEAALDEINAMPEAAQFALLRSLSKEHDTDAADVLIALNALSPNKAVRKEARRSLIRLEGARIYPHWNPPIERTPAFEIDSQPPHFWKGVVSDTFDAGEVNLMLCWEQGNGQVRLMGFLLEFWLDGVKDFFTEVGGKRHIDEHLAEMRASIETKECTLAEGRRLIQEALDVNKQHGTAPHSDYRRNLPLIKRLVLEAPDAGEDAGTSFIKHGITPEQVVTGFVEAVTLGRYSLAYDLLSSESPVRDGLSRQEWVKRRETWAQTARPARFKPGFADEREQQRSGLWLPNPFGGKRSTTRKEIEAAWSLELIDTPLNEGLKELPTATITYPETKRHWFRASYVLVQEQDEWRIQEIIDEGANLRQLSIEELQERIEEQDKHIESVTKRHKPTDRDAILYLGEIMTRTMYNLSYGDALLEKLPLDRTLYQQAAGRAVLVQDLERAVVYQENLARRFAEGRAQSFLELAATQIRLSENSFQDLSDERAERFQELAEANLRESMTIEDSAQAHLLLATLLRDRGKVEDLQEAKKLLLDARPLATDTETQVGIEDELAHVALDQDEFEQALEHFRRIIEIDPTDANAWFDLGETYADLDNIAEAETSYRHALEFEPDYIEVYPALLRLYLEDERPEQGQKLIEDGLRHNPDSAQLRASLAVVLAAFGDYPQAKKLLDEAERIDPELPTLPVYRATLETYKPKQVSAPNPSMRGAAPGKAKKRKKR